MSILPTPTLDGEKTFHRKKQNMTAPLLKTMINHHIQFLTCKKEILDPNFTVLLDNDARKKWTIDFQTFFSKLEMRDAS